VTEVEGQIMDAARRMAAVCKMHMSDLAGETDGAFGQALGAMIREPAGTAWLAWGGEILASSLLLHLARATGKPARQVLDEVMSDLQPGGPSWLEPGTPDI
jgi:hypothetical protein